MSIEQIYDEFSNYLDEQIQQDTSSEFYEYMKSNRTKIDIDNFIDDSIMTDIMYSLVDQDLSKEQFNDEISSAIFDNENIIIAYDEINDSEFYNIFRNFITEWLELKEYDFDEYELFDMTEEEYSDLNEFISMGEFGIGSLEFGYDKYIEIKTSLKNYSNKIMPKINEVKKDVIDTLETLFKVEIPDFDSSGYLTIESGVVDDIVDDFIVRVSDHPANWDNFEDYNSGFNPISFVVINNEDEYNTLFNIELNRNSYNDEIILDLNSGYDTTEELVYFLNM